MSEARESGVARLAGRGVDLAYGWDGDPAAPVLVLVNGLLTDRSSWARHLPAFTSAYRCLTYDCRGQGASSKPDHPYAAQLHADDLIALLDHLAVDRAAVVGLSNGGAASLCAAADHPGRIVALAVSGAYAHVDPLLRAKLSSWVRAMAAGGPALRFDVATPWVWGGRFLADNLEGLLSFRERGVGMPQRPVENLIEGAMIHDVRDRLAKIRAPTLVTVGEEDVLTPPALSRAIAGAVPGARLEIVEGRGHAAALEDVAGFCGQIRRFLDPIVLGAAAR
ncbi:MAG: alpha/beta fold hydrolase [Nannocystaceae bacterium]